MSIVLVSSATIEGNSLGSIVANPGDLMVIWAFVDGSNTAPSQPGGWTVKDSGGVNNCSMMFATKVAASSSEVSGTWTSATLLTAHVYSGVLATGAENTTGGTASPVNYTSLSLTVTDGSSWVVGFVGHTSVNDTVSGAPTGMTNRTVMEGVTNDGASHDTNGPVASWAGGTVANAETVAGWISGVMEITAAATPPSPHLLIQKRGMSQSVNRASFI
jgi:hypothetical protein